MPNSGPNCFHFGDYGIAIIAEIEGFTADDPIVSAIYFVTKPSGSTVQWTASPEGYNRLRYVTIYGDFNEAGDYTIRAKITSGSGVVWSSYDTFTIETSPDAGM